MFYLIAHFVLRPLFLLLFRPHVVGRENVPASGPFILASNHLSFIDSMVIPLMAPRKVGYLAKAEYFTTPGFGGWWSRVLFTALGALPVHRGTHRAAQEALDTAMSVLNEGGGFGIYPEGTRSKDGKLARGKTGVGWLALTADCPVVPVGVIGTDKIQPIGAQLAAPAPLHGHLRRADDVPRARRSGRQQPGPARGHRPDHERDRRALRPGEGRLGGRGQPR